MDIMEEGRGRRKRNILGSLPAGVNSFRGVDTSQSVFLFRVRYTTVVVRGGRKGVEILRKRNNNILASFAAGI